MRDMTLIYVASICLLGVRYPRHSLPHPLLLSLLCVFIMSGPTDLPELMIPLNVFLFLSVILLYCTHTITLLLKFFFLIYPLPLVFFLFLFLIFSENKKVFQKTKATLTHYLQLQPSTSSPHHHKFSIGETKHSVTDTLIPQFSFHNKFPENNQTIMLTHY